MTSRLKIHQYVAPITAKIPDLSEYPTWKRVLIGIAVSLVLHLLLFLLIVFLDAVLPKPTPQAPAPPKTIELTVVPEEAREDTLLPLAPNPQQRFLDTTGLDISKVAPPNPDFESSENGVAASELPGTGAIPLPSQAGRDLPFLAFKTQKALFGPSSKPFPAAPETTSLQDPSPKVEPFPEDPEVMLKPAPEPEKTAKAQPPSTPAPPSTPPPKSDQKTEAPAIAAATPSPLKTAEKVKEDEIAVSTKPPATPPPSVAETKEPQPITAPTPAPRPAAPTPRKESRQVMLVTPAPRSEPPSRSSSQLEQEQNRMEGSISNRGKRGVNSVATPLGKYRKQVIDAIGSRWQYYVKSHSDVLALGSAKVSFYVDTSGKVRGVRVENNTSNESFADLCERAIREAEIPEPPAEALAPMRDGRLEYSINFTLYSL